MQHEIVSPQPLLRSDGRITEEGWARFPYWRYDRKAIKAPPLRVKEWDYYSILSPDGRYGLTLTASDLDYAGLFAVCFLDFEKAYFCQVDSLSVLPRGGTGLGPDSDAGSFSRADGKLVLEFEYRPGVRILSFAAPGIVDAEGEAGLSGRIELAQAPDLQSLNIATSWAEDRRAFYYNRKINCMPATGGFSVGKNRYGFDPERDFGALDWGRGNWTYSNRWFWASASGWADGIPFGWNLGYGFTDRTPASENVLFHGGIAHKIEEVEFVYDAGDYLKPWRFASSDGRFEMDFKPLVDRNSAMDLGLIASRQHQVFGEYSGTAVLDDGRRVEVDRFLGFAEDVANRF